VGCDYDITRIQQARCVSIHAPTWGATKGLRPAVIAYRFQSTHPRGVRPAMKTYNITNRMFQSTHPRGVRHIPHSSNQPGRSFNPRTHVGCDILYAPVAILVYVSIHAPTWGATSIVRFVFVVPSFQSTHPRGVRQHMCKLLKINIVDTQ